MIASEKQNLSFGNGNGSNLLDASFSSYLNSNGTEESFVVKLTHSGHHPTVINSLSVIPNPSPQHAFLSKKKVEDGEIGIFGAEKYFKGTVEDMPRGGVPSMPNSMITRHDNQLKDDQEPVVIPKAHSATPSIRSESSWNSRSGLLHAASRNRSRREQNKGSSNGNAIKSLFASLGCHCNDKNSVRHAHEHRAHHGKEIAKIIVPEKEKVINVEDLVRRNKSLSSRWEEEDVHVKTTREECFSFPVLSSSKIVAKMEVREEETRNSLEVFGSPILEKGKKSFSLERKVSMLNWDGVTPRVENLDISKNGNNADAESDASSDLFEIESFSTTNGNSFLARQASGRDNNPANDYAPSEASIEWSVVTASVAGFSVASNYGGDAPKPEKNHSYVNRNAKIDMEKRGTGILSGCTSLKSVRVAGDEQWTTADKPTGTTLRDRRRLDSISPIVKYQAETKLMTGFDPRRAQNGYDPRSLARPLPPSASHNLYHSIA